LNIGKTIKLHSSHIIPSAQGFKKSTKKIQPSRRRKTITYLDFPTGLNSSDVLEIMSLAPEV
jgi:hypothetical protein